MRAWLVAIAVCFFVPTSTDAQQRETPYTAYVTADDVYVRSGPAKSPYYPTGKLKKGDPVEVYRHDPGGWCAIRPPEGSFSWVSGRYLSAEGDGLARVTGDLVAARVGSQFSEIREVIQVRLDKGELVEILDEKGVGDRISPATWYRVAPPSGEFRWISVRYLDADYMNSGVRQSSSVSPLMAELEPASASPAEPRRLAGLDAAPSETAEPLTADRPVARWIDTSQTAEASFSDDTVLDTGNAEILQTAGTATQGIYRSPNLPELEPRRVDAPSVAEPMLDFQTEWDNINLDLSIMLAEEASVWYFDELRLRAGALLVNAETAIERGRARTIVHRIDRSAEIKKRYDAVSTMQADTQRRNQHLAQVSRARPEESVAPRSSERPAATPSSRFDAAGKLARVRSSRVGMPRYALLNEQGDVLCYVNPAPGVNMEYHVGRYIGVTGVRGYFSEKDSRLVTAKHVSAVPEMTTR